MARRPCCRHSSTWVSTPSSGIPAGRCFPSTTPFIPNHAFAMCWCATNKPRCMRPKATPDPPGGPASCSLPPARAWPTPRRACSTPSAIPSPCCASAVRWPRRPSAPAPSRNATPSAFRAPSPNGTPRFAAPMTCRRSPPRPTRWPVPDGPVRCCSTSRKTCRSAWCRLLHRPSSPKTPGRWIRWRPLLKRP